MLRFAAVGLDHGHIFDHVKGLLATGAEFVGYCPETTAPGVLEAMEKNYSDVPKIDRDRIFEDPKIDVICISAVPADRAGLAVRAMKAGKDVMLDKPGVTTFEQLAEVRETVEKTGKIFSVCFTERHSVRSAVKAGKLVQEGAIGRVIQTIGTGPHKLQLASRPDWFFDPKRFGGIIVDIASHQIDQFLFYTGSKTGEIVASSIGNFTMPKKPAFQDFGDILLRSDNATGYVRVDWLTPEGLGTWGDGRLIILGTKGYIELRKYIDISGRQGKDHLFLINGTENRYIDCSDEELIYFRAFVDDVAHRTETAMSQAHVFEVCRLSLEAQANAARIGAQGEY
ncbi:MULTISPECIES: Gfo/Idh/MocA family protein [Rhizobium]|uniref:Gfo/Idh/MocA family oxidoreductase n=1 Tax=Rhizobium lentis TaxID=1138194 RepID=A0ABS7ICK9_9HYPH|nr:MULTISPECIES: Gfo/Idh/MocA family oxidoreductase [Rhizobium]MBX4922274.1 Gfo/Idh/MocA family oxidoreductase [Rhizobium bangladeshense]MBX5088281.1 Gfo/Idh/MocA family oxidoreductase [Rhizobium lentis]MBX5101219.1 Gfo/Idh/MocA family oxidoreductase [Rhizobium lentis]